MYSRFAKEPAYYTQERINDMKELVPGIDDETGKRLDDERTRLLEILGVCIDLSTYLLVLSLRATAKIDQRAHLHVKQDLVSYGRDAMQEVLVIRLRDLFQTEKDKPEIFKFYGFYQTLSEFGKDYPKPNLETSNAIARIIKRRRFYSAHHGNGKNEYSFEKNRLQSLDLATAMSYIAKVETNLYRSNESKTFDPFEVLLNDEVGDRNQVLCGVYEVVTGKGYEVLNYTAVLKTLPSGVQVVDGEYEDTAEFASYETKARKELQRIKLRVESIVC